ncbi:MAG: nickel-binding protein [Polyangiales bacterium]
MEHVIAERVFAEPVSLEAVDQALRNNESCLNANRVRHLRSCVSLDGLRMICEYEAPDAETVRRISQQLGVPYERVWTARIYTRDG